MEDIAYVNVHLNLKPFLKSKIIFFKVHRIRKLNDQEEN